MKVEWTYGSTTNGITVTPVLTNAFTVTVGCTALTVGTIADFTMSVPTTALTTKTEVKAALSYVN